MTALEKIVATALSKIGFCVIVNKDDFLQPNTWISQLQFSNFRLDFASPILQLAIEVDGNYWHASHGKCRHLQRFLTDRNKDAALRSCGWDIIRVKEKIIKQNNFVQWLDSQILCRIVV
jgi:very-short-patch-repair endonuclease